MNTGAITGYIDVAQIVLYVFWIFFAWLVIYLHREDKREGYPLESESPNIKVQGYPAVPSPKTFRLPHGGEVSVPNDNPAPQPPVHEGAWRGMPLQPEGDPMQAGVGPGSWNARADTVDLGFDGLPRIAPLRRLPDFGVDGHDVDPRQLPMVGADGVAAGQVVDLWVDRADVQFRYLEVAMNQGPNVLVPINFCVISRRAVRVEALHARHFADLPRPRDPDTVTLLEEEKIMAYCGAGLLYATPQRQEPLF
jgi:photosynthetic reaction center H subunit